MGHMTQPMYHSTEGRWLVNRIKGQSLQAQLRPSTLSTGKMFICPPAIPIRTQFSTIFFHTITYDCLI